jgi:hypothetical protein
MKKYLFSPAAITFSAFCFIGLSLGSGILNTLGMFFHMAAIALHIYFVFEDLMRIPTKHRGCAPVPIGTALSPCHGPQPYHGYARINHRKKFIAYYSNGEASKNKMREMLEQHYPGYRTRGTIINK